MADTRAPIDVVGTGSFIPRDWHETYATADIVAYGDEVRVKVGREFLLRAHQKPRRGTQRQRCRVSRMSEAKTWRVRILDLSGGAEDNIVEEVGPFATLDDANLFARRYVRDSVERCRATGHGRARRCWTPGSPSARTRSCPMPASRVGPAPPSCTISRRAGPARAIATGAASTRAAAGEEEDEA